MNNNINNNKKNNIYINKDIFYFFLFFFHLHVFFLLKSVQKLSAPNFCDFKILLYLCGQKFNDNKKAFLLIFGFSETWTLSVMFTNKIRKDRPHVYRGLFLFGKQVVQDLRKTIRLSPRLF